MDNQTETHRSNLLKLADAIEADGGSKFDMKTVGDPACGTPGCFMGWAHKLFFGFEDVQTIEDDDNVAKTLGLSRSQFDDLCYPSFVEADLHAHKSRRAYISHERAVAQLRHVALTGTVDWKATP